MICVQNRIGIGRRGMRRDLLLVLLVFACAAQTFAETVSGKGWLISGIVSINVFGGGVFYGSPAFLPASGKFVSIETGNRRCQGNRRILGCVGGKKL
jgi:hypothetical protein